MYYIVYLKVPIVNIEMCRGKQRKSTKYRTYSPHPSKGTSEITHLKNKNWNTPQEMRWVVKTKLLMGILND